MNGATVERMPMVRNAIQQLNGRFSIHHIADLIKLEHRLDIGSKFLSDAMNKLRKRGEVVQVEKGIGRRPAFYQRREVRA